jgi:hypothetical protein
MLLLSFASFVACAANCKSCSTAGGGYCDTGMCNTGFMLSAKTCQGIVQRNLLVNVIAVLSPTGLRINGAVNKAGTNC